MNHAEKIRTLLHQLIQAENERSRALADVVLSPQFLGLTRARGVERNRDELLADIEAGGHGMIQRSVEEDPEVEVSPTENWALARSVVVVTRSDERAVVRPAQRYRNLHVFALDASSDGVRWRCIAWQVTELK